MSGLIIAFSCNDEIPHDPAIVIDDAAVEGFIRFNDFSVDEAFRASTRDPEKIAEQITTRIPEFERQHRIDLGYRSSRASSFAREIAESKSNPDLAQKMVYYSSISNCGRRINT